MWFTAIRFVPDRAGSRGSTARVLPYRDFKQRTLDNGHAAP
jgi:hypothetical protein